MNQSENREIGEYRLDLESLQEAWGCNEDDIHVNLTTGEAFYQNGRIPVDPTPEGDWRPKALWEWMNLHLFWPNVWLVNDHGNVELVSIDEDGTVTYHGGLV